MSVAPLNKTVIFLLALSLSLLTPISARGETPDATEDVEEETLIPLPDNPDLFLNAGGEIVDEFGLIIRLYENKDVCIRCHYSKERYERLVLDWDRSKHSKNKVTCSRCHGGNPDAENIGDAKNSKTTNYIHVKEPLRELTFFWSGGSPPQSGKVIELAFHYCGQCHGTIFRDWKVGVHGKRTGYWNGRKEYRNCFRCHNPHNPKYSQLKPEPPPLSPEQIKFHPPVQTQRTAKPVTKPLKNDK